MAKKGLRSTKSKGKKIERDESAIFSFLHSSWIPDRVEREERPLLAEKPESWRKMSRQRRLEGTFWEIFTCTLYSNVHQCTAMNSNVQQCTTMYRNVQKCTAYTAPTYTDVNIPPWYKVVPAFDISWLISLTFLCLSWELCIFGRRSGWQAGWFCTKKKSYSYSRVRQ